MTRDYIIRATAGQGSVRAFACTTREIVETARCAHNSSPVVTAAMGRLLTAGAMMGSMLKSESDVLTLMLRGAGEMKGVTVTADSSANVKGYPTVANVCIPANDKGKLDVSGAIGAGMLSVVKDLGLKDPYVGQVELISGEIAEDLAYYFATSEQVPSAVALGVLMNKDNTVKQAGGFIVQVLPGASDEMISMLEQHISGLPSMTAMLDEGMTPEQILEAVLEGMEPEILDKFPTQFRCDCDKERVSHVLASLSKDDIREMVEDNEPIEVCCRFCGKAYKFSIDEMQALLSAK